MDFSKLKDFMDFMAAQRTPGNAIEVYLGGKSVFRYASGYSNYENRIPLTGDEMYNIYSCSKVTTVTAGAQLLEQGKLLLTDPLYDYLPEFRQMYVRTPDGDVTKAQNPITIGDLFTMTAGFDYNMNSAGFQKAREVTGGSFDTVETIRCVAMDPLSFEPGTHWQYSICHDVLAAVISVVSGQKFRDYVKTHIFDPLDMTESVYHHTPKTLERTAEQYSFIFEGNEAFDIVEAQKSGKGNQGYFKNVGKEISYVLGAEYDSGGAGIITTVSDYAKLAAALAGRGGELGIGSTTGYGMTGYGDMLGSSRMTGYTGHPILSSYMVDLIRTNRLTPEQMKDYNWMQCTGCGYGLGVRTHMNPAKSGIPASIGEFGWGGAAGATVMVDPKIGLGVFYVQHCLNPREEFYQPRLRSIVYGCLD